jgi:hypothetical protein
VLQLTYKHFVPLIPTSKVLEKQLSAEAEDPAKGLISRDLSLCLSVSARLVQGDLRGETSAAGSGVAQKR